MQGIMRNSCRIERKKPSVEWEDLGEQCPHSPASHYTLTFWACFPHCLAASIVSAEKLLINLLGVLLYMVIHFSLAAFKIFSLSLAFDTVIMMYLDMDLFVLSYLEPEKNNGGKLPNLMKNTTWPESSTNAFSSHFSLSSSLRYCLYGR